MEYQHWLREAISQLQASESPRRDAEILLEHVTGRGRTFILAFGETQLTDEQCQQLDALLTRRRDGEPIAHLTGVREFWSLPLFVSPATLIPRPDTECLVEQALARLPEQPCRILDLGTGTGAIALALASERPDCEIIAVDRMPDAVSLAQRNAQHLAIKNIHILQSDWFSALAGQQFAMIVSNPPYIAESEKAGMDRNVLDYEPSGALFVPDDDPLRFYKALSRFGADALKPGGRLYFEINSRFPAEIKKMLDADGYVDVELLRDMQGLWRFARAHKRKD